MRRLLLAALVAAPFLLFTGGRQATAAPPGYEHFGFFGYAFKNFSHIHQEGPLYNYGPYYGYYPFKPYGPWDAYLRYDPFFYGDPYANWGKNQGNYYDRGKLWDKGGFWHASWLHGGWFRGHTWLTGHCASCGHLGHKKGCSSCGGISTATPIDHTDDPITRYTGFGTPAQSSVFYPATPTLDPVLDLQPVPARTR